MVHRLTATSHGFVRDRVARVSAKREKDTHKLPFDVRDVGRRNPRDHQRPPWVCVFLAG